MIHDIKISLDNYGELDIDNDIQILQNFTFMDISAPTAIKNTFTKTVSIPSTPNNDHIFSHVWRFDSNVFDFNASKRENFKLSVNGEVFTSGYIKLNSIEYKNGSPSSYNITLYGGIGDFFYEISEKYLHELNMPDANYTHRITAQNVANSWTNDYPYTYALTYSGNYENFDSDKTFTSFSQDFPYGLIELQYDPVIDASYGLFPTGGGIFGLAKIKYGENPEIIDVSRIINFSDWKPYPRMIFDPNRGRYIIFKPGNALTVLYSFSRENPSEISRDVLERPAVAGTYPLVDINIIDYTYQPDEKRNRYGYLFANGVIAFEGDFLSQRYYVIYTLIQFTDYESRMLINSFGPASSGVVQSGGIITKCGLSANQVYKIQILGTPALIATVTLLNVTVNQVGSAAEKIVLNDSRDKSYFTISESKSLITFEFNSYNEQSPRDYLFNVPDGTFMTSSSRRADNKAVCFFGQGNGIFMFQSTDQNNSPRTLSSNNAPLLPDHNVTTGMTYSGNPYVGSGYTGKYIVSWHTSSGSTDTRLSYLTGPTPTGEWENNSGYFVTEGTEVTNEHYRGEYRSYYQRPMLKLSPILEQIFIDSSYDYEIDEDITNSPYYANTWLIMHRLQYDGAIPENHVGNIRSGDTVTYSMMMKKGISQLNFLTSYMKMLGLILVADHNNKKVSLMTRKTYFSEFSKINYDEKLDTSKAITVNPLTFNDKYLVFKYEDAGSRYEELYEEIRSRSYGQTHVDTGYDFDDSEIEMIPGNVFQNTVFSTEYSRYFEGRNGIDAFADNKALPALFQTSNDNEIVYNDSSMHLVFRRGLNLTPNPFPIRLTDDVVDMLEAGLFMWNLSDQNAVYSNFYPNVFKLGAFDGEMFSLDFGRPQDFYYRLIGEYPDAATIYSKCWKEFIEEIYNVNNKILTCYLNLDISDMNRFMHNRFVIIRDSLFFVNKVIDFNINDNNTTKCELIRVSDISKYGVDEFFFDITHNHYDVRDGILHFPNEGGAISFNVNSSHSFTINTK